MALGGLLTFFVWFAWPVSAATPATLPPSESLEDWGEALRLADLESRQASSGARVRFLASGDSWTIEATDLAGTLRSVTIQRPQTPDQREDAAMIAASLLRSARGTGWSEIGPAAWPRVPAPPTAVPDPVPHALLRAPALTKSIAPPALPVVAPVSSNPVVQPVAASDSSIPVVQPTASPPTPQLALVNPTPLVTPPITPDPPASESVWPALEGDAVRVSPDNTSITVVKANETRRPNPLPWSVHVLGGGSVRESLSVAAVVGIGAEVGFDSFYAGVGAAFVTAHSLATAPQGGRMNAADVVLRVGAELPGKVKLGAGFFGGAGWRVFFADDAAVGSGWTPVAGGEIRVKTNPVAGLSVGPTLTALADLRETEFWKNGASTGTMSPFELRLGITLGIP